MMPRTAIAQVAKMIGSELDFGAGPSEEAVAAGPLLAEAGATAEIVGWLLAEAHRKRPDDRMIAAYAVLLERCPRNATAAGERRRRRGRPRDRRGAQQAR
jgi:hypothetical protein